jgi:succinate-semialdehyde dehydrogenase/glutarate-semialdehyde dehydrogenase
MQLTDPTLLRRQCYVGGRWLDAADGRTLTVTNPATGAALGTVPQLGAAATRAAIEAAAAAFPAWAAQTAKQRAIILRRWFDLMMANQQDLATLMTAVAGQAPGRGHGRNRYAAAYIEWFAEEARRVYGEVIPGHQADKRIVVLRQPVGVVAAITRGIFRPR